MRKRRLGAGGAEVFPVGLGAMSIAGFYGDIDDAGAEALLAKALDLGVDHLDTSNVYGAGLSEQRIGGFLRKQGSRAQDMFQIATKAGITKDAAGNRCFDNSAQHLEAELDKSLKRLGVEQVALFYVHRREAARPIEEVTETLASLVKSGKIASFGYSEIAPTSLADAHAVHPVAAVQSEYSLSVRAPELGLLQQTERLGAALVAFSPVGRGLLTDTPPDAANAAAIDFLRSNPRFTASNLERNIAAIAPFRALASDMGVATATLAIAWTLHQGEHVISIPGTRTPAHLQELAAGAEMSLSASDMAAIEQALPVGWCYGDRYTTAQWIGPERYC